MAKSSTVNYRQKSINTIVRDAYKIYGTYVNNERHIPNFYDGLKPVYKKAIYGTMNTASDHLNKAVTVIGEVMKYYPHGDRHVTPVLAQLARVGIFVNESNNGCHFFYKNDISHAAARYLDVMINPFYNKLFSKLIKYVPYVEGELGYKEPAYIPTPIPLGLTFGFNGMSCGCNTEIPPFTAQSILRAMQNDDPYELKMSFGLEIDKDESDLYNIWYYGSGKLVFRYPMEYGEIDGQKGFIITGDPEYIKPGWHKKINDPDCDDITLPDLVKRGTVEVIETNKMLFVKMRDSSMTGVVQEYLENCITNFKLVKLTVSKNGKVGRVSMKNWIKSVYDNYISLLEDYRLANIERLKRDRLVQEALPIVTKILLDHRDWDNHQIAVEANVEDWIVSKIMEKSISTLKRTKKVDEVLLRIDNQIEEFKSFNPTEYTNNIILQIPE